MVGAHHRRRSRRLTRPCPHAVLSWKGTPKKPWPSVRTLHTHTHIHTHRRINF
jgi:hypothetical protein